MDAVPYNSSAGDPLGGSFTGASGAAGEECERVLAWWLMTGPGEGVVAADRGVPIGEDHIEEGVGDNEIIDSSRNSDRVGISSAGGDCRFGCGISTGRDPCVSRVAGIPSRHDSTVARALILELSGEPTSLAPSFAEKEGSVPLAGTTC